MITRIKSVIYSQWHNLQTWIAQQKSPPPAGLCCITVQFNQFSFCYFKRGYQNQKIEIAYANAYFYDEQNSENDFSSVLSTIIKEKKLKKAKCVWLLDSADYQLILTDALPVTAAEFQAAIRWKIKDEIKFSIEDMIVDAFPIPRPKTETQDKIIAVAAQKSYLEKITKTIQLAGLDLISIDIPELNLDRLLALCEPNNPAAALLYIRKTNANLLINVHEELYFSRNLELDFELNNSENTLSLEEFNSHLDHLAKEIQRSLNYYYGQFCEAYPGRILIGVAQPISENAINYLAQKLAISIERMDITKHFIFSEQQNSHLPMMGVALQYMQE